MKRVLSAAAIVCCTAAAPAPAQENRWQQQVASQLARTVTSFRAQGFARQEATHTAPLDNEESETFTVTLTAGVAYTLAGVCDVDCEHLALRLSTATGSDLAVDQSSGALPVVAVTPAISGTYRVTVRMAACRMSPCWYGVALLRK